MKEVGAVKVISDEEIRRKGLAALRRELGRSGMIRFLEQFETGRGDYAPHDFHRAAERAGQQQ
jgi:hypothetical protein